MNLDRTIERVAKVAILSMEGLEVEVLRRIKRSKRNPVARWWGKVQTHQTGSLKISPLAPLALHTHPATPTRTPFEGSYPTLARCRYRGRGRDRVMVQARTSCIPTYCNLQVPYLLDVSY